MSRSCTDTDSPGATDSHRYQAAALVPGCDAPPGSTTWHASATPFTTWSSMPALVYRLGLRPRPNSPTSSVSLSVTSIVGDPLTCSVYRPVRECSATTRAPPPRPRVAQPQLRQQVQRRGVGPLVGDGDVDAEVVRRGLGVGHAHVEE